MSKKLWTGPIKFGDGARPLRPLPKVRIKGVDNESILGQRILAEYAGIVGQFHMAQAQNYSLAPQAIYRGHREYDDISLRYTNLSGQEIIDIEVRPEVLEQVGNPGFVPWDWTITNFKVIDPPEGGATFAAIMRVPVLSGLIYNGEMPRGTTTSGTGEKPISFPDRSNPEFEELAAVPVDDGYTAGSLRNDLRVVGPESAVVVDVYGKIEGALMCMMQAKRLPIVYEITFPTPDPDSDLSPSPWLDTTIWYLRGNTTFRRNDCTTITIYWHLAPQTMDYGNGPIPPTLSQDFTISSFAEDGGGGSVDTVVTATAVRTGGLITLTISADNDYLTFVGEWADDPLADDPNARLTALGWWEFGVEGRDGVNGWVEGSYDTAVTISYSNPSQVGPTPSIVPLIPKWDYDGAYAGSLSYNTRFLGYLEATPEPDEDDAQVLTRDLVVAGIIERGDPEWVFSEHSNEFGFDAWEMLAHYPNPVPTGTLAVTKIRTAFTPDDTSAENHFGLPYLGRIIADRRYGALTFTPAED